MVVFGSFYIFIWALDGYVSLREDGLVVYVFYISFVGILGIFYKDWDIRLGFLIFLVGFGGGGGVCRVVVGFKLLFLF